MATVSLCLASAKFSTASLPPPPSRGPSPADFRVFYREHVGFVRRVLGQRGVSASVVEDLAQEVFLLAFRRWEVLKVEEVRPWLYVVALHFGMNYRKLSRHRLEKLCEEVPETRVTEYDPEVLDVARFFERAVKRLRPKIREVFVRYALREEPIERIAADLGIPLKTAYSRVDLAKASIARIGARARW